MDTFENSAGTGFDGKSVLGENDSRGKKCCVGCTLLSDKKEGPSLVDNEGTIGEENP